MKIDTNTKKWSCSSAYYPYVTASEFILYILCYKIYNTIVRNYIVDVTFSDFADYVKRKIYLWVLALNKKSEIND